MVSLPNDFHMHGGAYQNPKHHGMFQIYNTEVKVIVISLVIPNTTCLLNQYNKGNLE